MVHTLWMPFFTGNKHALCERAKSMNHSIILSSFHANSLQVIMIIAREKNKVGFAYQDLLRVH